MVFSNLCSILQFFHIIVDIVLLYRQSRKRKNIMFSRNKLDNFTQEYLGDERSINDHGA